MTGHPSQHARPMLALGLRLASAVMLSIMLLQVKLVGQRGVWLPETMVWRQFVPALLLFGWLTVRGEWGRLRTDRPWIHARRAASGTFGMFLTLGAVLLLPLSEATVLGFTAPIFAVILSMLLLHETVGPWRFGAVALGLAGVVVIANPVHVHLPLGGLLVGVGAAFMVSLISIQLRDLGRTEAPVTIVFWFSTMSLPMMLPVLAFSPVPLFRHDLATWAMIGGIGVSGLFAQLLMTAALRFGRVSSVIVMDYSQFGWSTLWGWLVFDHLPPATTWLGAPLIIAAGLIIAWREGVRMVPRASADALNALADSA